MLSLKKSMSIIVSLNKIVRESLVMKRAIPTVAHDFNRKSFSSHRPLGLKTFGFQTKHPALISLKIETHQKTRRNWSRSEQNVHSILGMDSAPNRLKSRMTLCRRKRPVPLLTRSILWQFIDTLAGERCSRNEMSIMQPSAQSKGRARHRHSFRVGNNERPFRKLTPKWLRRRLTIVLLLSFGMDEFAFDVWCSANWERVGHMERQFARIHERPANSITKINSSPEFKMQFERNHF